MSAIKSEILHSQRQQGRLDDAGEFPKVILVDTVSNCNLKCVMCVHKSMLREKGAMSWDLFTKIVDEIALEDPHARVWMVFFGEALILKRKKPSIFDMIAYAKKKGLTDVVLNSNANLLDKESSRKLMESGLDAIYFGIDAHSKDTYALIRVGGNYETVVANVQNLIRLKKEKGVGTPKVFVQFVEMDSNKHEKEGFIDFWTKQGASVKIRPKVSWGGLIDAPNLVLGKEDRWPCYWAMRGMAITNLGKVVTCAVDLDASFIAGDVRSNSMKEIWLGELKKLRTLHLEGRFGDLPDLCRACKDWQSARAEYY